MRETTISFVKSARSSARMKQLGPHCTDSHRILYLRIFRKSVQKTQVPLKSGKITGPLHEKLRTLYHILLNSSLNKKCFRQRLQRNQNTHFMFNNFFPRKSCRL